MSSATSWTMPCERGDMSMPCALRSDASPSLLQGMLEAISRQISACIECWSKCRIDASHCDMYVAVLTSPQLFLFYSGRDACVGVLEHEIFTSMTQNVNKTLKTNCQFCRAGHVEFFMSHHIGHAHYNSVSRKDPGK